MFRFNNPDALLTLLLVGSAYAALRAVESVPASGPLARTGRGTGGAGVPHQDAAGVPGLPALGLVYLLFAHTSFPKRLGHLLVGLGAMVASAGWWVAIVSLWPADSRPYIGGSPGQLDPRADARLQRLRPAHRQRGRLGRRRWRERRHVGRDRPGPAPERRDRRPDRLAAADRAAAPRGRAVVHPPGRAHRCGPGRPGALGRVAGRHRGDVQLHGRDLPRLLHGGAGPRDRRPGRHRCLAALAAPHLAARLGSGQRGGLA